MRAFPATWVRVTGLCLLGLAGLPGRTSAGAPLCNAQTYYESYCGTHPDCVVPNNPGGTTVLIAPFYCGNQSAAGEPYPAGGLTWGCWQGPPTPEACASLTPTTAGNCAALGGEEVCDGTDNDFNGCVDERCKRGKGECSCERSCSAGTCNPAKQATCRLPYDPEKQEQCGDGADNDCNGLPDEGCPEGGGGGGGGGGGPLPSGPPPPQCRGKAGKDPIYLATRAAVTEPFTDFQVTHVTPLSLTRIYSSADASLTRFRYASVR